MARQKLPPARQPDAAVSVLDITYDPLTHTSRHPDGRPVPHVTAILGDVGVSTSFEDLCQISPRIEAAIIRRGQLGTAVHAACHYFDDGDDLDPESVSPEVRQYLEAWEICRDRLDLEPLRLIGDETGQVQRERRIFHPLYFYTGILDGIFRQTSTGKVILGDLKIGNPEDSACHLQTAAYAEAHQVMHPTVKIDERWAIALRPGRIVPYEITNYSARQTAWMDFNKFLSCLCVYNEQPSRRRV